MKSKCMHEETNIVHWKKKKIRKRVQKGNKKAIA